MAFEQRLERILQVADWVDVAHLAIGDETGEQCPVFRSDLVTGEECVFARKGNFSDLIFDRVGVQLKAAVLQEPRQTRSNAPRYTGCLQPAWRMSGCARAVLQARGGRPR